MNKQVYFTVGPSAIYPNVDHWTNDFYQKGYTSEYHRSSVFQSIYQHLDEQLRLLLNIPSTHAIFLLEFWVRNYGTNSPKLCFKI
jgi:phosphoserine aminotransferase